MRDHLQLVILRGYLRQLDAINLSQFIYKTAYELNVTTTFPLHYCRSISSTLKFCGTL